MRTSKKLSTTLLWVRPCWSRKGWSHERRCSSDKLAMRGVFYISIENINQGTYRIENPKWLWIIIIQGFQSCKCLDSIIIYDWTVWRDKRGSDPSRVRKFYKQRLEAMLAHTSSVAEIVILNTCWLRATKTCFTLAFVLGSCWVPSHPSMGLRFPSLHRWGSCLGSSISGKHLCVFSSIRTWPCEHAPWR